MIGIVAAIAGASAIAVTIPRLINMRTHGLYWDSGRTWTLENWPRLVEELRDLKIDHIVVNTNGSKAAIEGKAGGRWSPAHLARLQAARGAPSIHAMIWAAPTRAFADDFARYARQLASAGVRVVELDVERDAWGVAVRGFESREAAARELVRIAKDAGLVVGVTMIPARIYAGFEAADYIAVQAYSKYNGGAENHGHGAYYGPGNMQDRAARAAARAGLPCVIALAAYDQRWPSGPLADLRAIDIAWEGARRNSRSVRWWSSKWIVGHRADPEVKARIRALVRGKSYV